MGKLQILAAKIFLILSALVGFDAMAGVPVIDATNLSQNVTSAVEEVAQTIKQIEQYTTQIQQYSTQIQQYENMLQNTAAPAKYFWGDAQSSINSLLGVVNTINQYKSQYGNLISYLDQFKSIGQYQNIPCFTGGGCTATQWANLLSSMAQASTAQTEANKAAIMTLDNQNDEMQKDADQLSSLQSAAESADGQMKALGYANQLAGAQANQLMQIRALLIAQQNALVTRNQALANQEAMQAAYSEKFRAGHEISSPKVNW